PVAKIEVRARAYAGGGIRCRLPGQDVGRRELPGFVRNIGHCRRLPNRRLSAHVLTESSKCFVVVKELRRKPRTHALGRHAVIREIELLKGRCLELGKCGGSRLAASGA